jgi:hypothetical protein
MEAGGNILRSEIHELINSILNEEELPLHWKESVCAYLQKKGDITYCVNYRGTSVLPTTYKMFSNIISILTPNVDEITGDH